MKLTSDRLASELKAFVAGSYPKMHVQVVPAEVDPDRAYVFFVDAKFADLYPYQRWHYLAHLIPAEYQTAHLQNSIWFELAPGEDPDDLRYPDNELIESIAADVLKCLTVSRFFESLDEVMCPEDAGRQRVRCWGDFRNSRLILIRSGFKEEELFDVFHVLMQQGGFCDCEILYNVAEQSRLKAEYWMAKAEGLKPYDPHAGA